MVSQKILHYQLLEKIGAGGMGEIYKGQDSRLNRLVAVKILSPSLSTDPERRRRFFQEAQAASALNHPNIITLYDIVSEGDLQCIVMEYIAGKTLRELIPAKGLPAAQAIQYGAQIASALTAAHTAGIIHRDLKPSNIMVTSTGLIKVLDFGLAKWVDSGLSGQTGDLQNPVDTALTREGSIIGTVSYMSPEQAEGKHVDARSDIFSFGDVLYEMVTGKRAFEGRSGISTLSSILRDDVKPIYQSAPDVPPGLEQIILRCLPKDPASRWQTMKEIEGALITLQRQIDPNGYVAPLPTGPSSMAGVPPANITDASTGEPSPSSSPSFAPGPADSSAGATAILDGPSLHAARASSAVAVAIPVAAPKAPPIPPPRTAPKAPPIPPPAKRDSSRFGVLVLVLIGAALVTSLGIGGWWLWNYRQNQGIAGVPPAAATQPATSQPAAQPPANPPTVASATPPTEAPAPSAEPSAATPAGGPAKHARKPKPKDADSARNLPQISLPATTAPPSPLPIPPAPIVAPPLRPPAIQATPVFVSDASPFVIILGQDVPADAPEGLGLSFIVSDGLKVGEKTVIAKGATVTGAVIGESKPKKFLGFGGGRKLMFRLVQATAVDGKKVAVRALPSKNEEGVAARSFETGKSKPKGYAAVQGTLYIGYIDGDQTVAVHAFPLGKN